MVSAFRFWILDAPPSASAASSITCCSGVGGAHAASVLANITARIVFIVCALPRRPLRSFGSVRIAVHRVGRERWQTDGDVFRAVGTRCAVSNPLARSSDDRLSRVNIETASLVFHTDHAVQHDRNLLKLRPLAWL